MKIIFFLNLEASIFLGGKIAQSQVNAHQFLIKIVVARCASILAFLQMREETRLIYREIFQKEKRDYSEKIVFNLRFCLPKNHYLVLMEDYEIKLFLLSSWNFKEP